MNKFDTNNLDKLGSAVIRVGNSFAVFGSKKTDDMVVIGKDKGSKTRPSLHISSIKQKVTDDEVVGLFNKLQSLRQTNANAIFVLTSENIKRIKNSIKLLDATHIRIWTSENRITVTVFDCRDFEFDRRISRKNSLKINYLDIETRTFENFTFTLNADSFSKLPSTDCNFRIGKNGVTEVSPIDGDIFYLIRDQQLVEPVTVFESQSVGKDIAFLFHPN
jgi:hypothetical protein